jgi:limonene-1,2-epoxide hydrolase
MSEALTERFIKALGELESARDASGLEAIFSDDSDLGNVIVPEKFHGREGTKAFWTKYRDTFHEIRSTFRNRIISDGRAALEWTTEAAGVDGQPIHYEGVSILEFEGDKIKRFRAYFDPAALARQVKSERKAR